MSKEIEIRQHNALTNARYEYTELQLDLLFFLLSKLRKDKQDSVYELNIKDLSLLTGKKYNAAYLHKATSDMGSRVFEVQTETRYRQLWMFQRVDYLLGQGIIEIKLTEDITPYLFDLKENFTSYELASALRLTSKYAKRIYQYCSQWKDQGETKKYDIQDFKQMLGLLDDKGKDKAVRMSDFRESVLDVAVKQINEHTELHISYKLEKRVRTYKNIVFTVKPQALAETIPFDLVPTAQPLPGVQQSHYDNAARILDELRITDTKHRQTILTSAAHVAEVNRYNHDLKTGKVKASRNPGGLLLVRLGLVAAKATAPTK
ncbi:RepB family plasmid replication initiator protein [Hymenobacter sp. UV11]|uniref:replication initiation protein n=1 Tax=Hymenobacter sp. UV11 TaxID=1849735 RepID=UPI001062184D|nr:replication initiation protein [Hymenobacter sp. UV11]TDN38310.1 replication protein RepB [Hymenobacter sp. UV11]TFZ62227.1 RepB family plasmid replication initiator protein [Hymenobacter sp. UV11]